MALFLTQNLFVASGIDYLIYHAAVDTIGAFVGVESDSGQRTGSRAGGRLVQGGARGHRPERASRLRRPRLHGRQSGPGRVEHGIELEVVKHHEAKRGFILLPRRWVVERSFAWAARFRRLARDYERLTATLAAYHWLAFVSLMLNFIFQRLSTGSSKTRQTKIKEPGAP